MQPFAGPGRHRLGGSDHSTPSERSAILTSMLSDDPAPLRQLGPYRIVRRLGAGGMAEVHLARRFGASGWEKEVAIKVLRAEHRGHAELERLLIAEAHLGARFAHPALVQVHDLGLASGTYYVCMDYVDGGDLRALLRRRPLPRPLALYIGEQLALALAYVHRLGDEHGRPLGLVHRDVSPGNVLLSRSGAVKLSDFGIAKATAAEDRTWGRLRKGKYAYMAPEQIIGAELAGTADIFSLGITLHELLLGRHPFETATAGEEGPLAMMEAIRRASLPPEHDFADLSPGLCTLLRRTLARDPRERLGSAALLARELAEERRSLSAAGLLELSAWVGAAAGPPSATATTGSVNEEPAPETVGMDDSVAELPAELSADREDPEHPR